VTESWEDRVQAVYGDEALTDAERVAAVDALAVERGDDDPLAWEARGGIRDFIGDEAGAEVFYRRALAAGIDGEPRTWTLIQLASTVRNLGRPDESLALLTEAKTSPAGEKLADAIVAFEALALVSAGDAVGGAAVALRALAGHLPLYGRAVREYAGELASSRG
jgi:tetratricopeptide (TPR) repeat protein